MKRHYALSDYLRQRFGQRVQKIPLDAGFDCPNRDGAISRRGCVFCNPRGSGSGLLRQGYSLAQQWEHWRERLERRYKARFFLAYLQSFSNTHGPASKLKSTLEQLQPLPNLAGLCIGTRPDCLDQEKIGLLAGFQCSEKWLELGLQSANDATLERINRGHSAEDFTRAVHMASDAGLKICAHVVAGLPGEESEDFLNTIRFCNNQPIHGIKFHNLYVCADSGMARLWQRGEYVPLTMDAYAHLCCEALALLRPDVVVHRLTGDPAPGELLAPDWAANKQALLSCIHRIMEEKDILQGCAYSNM